MSDETRRRYMDVAFFHFPPPQQPENNNKTIWRVLAAVLAALLLVCIGYIVCLRTGLLQPCCVGSLEFDFDFDASTPEG